MEVEPALQERNVPRVRPFGDEDLMVLQEGLDRIPEQGGIVAGERRDDQHCGLGGCPSSAAKIQGVAGEVGQADPGVGPGLYLPDLDVDLANPDAVDPPLGPAIAAGEVGEEVRGREDPTPHGGLAGGVERRVPVGPGGAGGRPEGRGSVVSGFVEGVEHGPPLMLQRTITRLCSADVQPCRPNPDSWRRESGLRGPRATCHRAGPGRTARTDP